jgi:hypothetical protein
MNSRVPIGEIFEGLATPSLGNEALTETGPPASLATIGTGLRSSQGESSILGGAEPAATGTVSLIDTHITKNMVTGVQARGAGVTLSDTEHVDITVKNSPITDNTPENCSPVAEVPTCKNGAQQTPPSGSLVRLARDRQVHVERRPNQETVQRNYLVKPRDELRNILEG